MSAGGIPMRIHTLESATRVASKLAQEYGYNHYITETYVGPGSNVHLEVMPAKAIGQDPRTENEIIEGKAEGAAMLDGDQVMYSWYDEPSLARILAIGPDLAILRVARPDGTVAAVHDPGSVEGRLAAFCHMTDDERRARWDAMFGDE